MAQLDEPQMASLARELVYNIRNYKLVFADYGITEEDYCEIEKNEFYRKVRDHITLDWNSVGSSAERIKLESQAYYERLMTSLTKRALLPETPLMAANETAKLLAKTGGLGEKQDGAAVGADRFVITINLGADTETYNKSVEINPGDIDLGEKHGQRQLDRPSPQEDGSERHSRQLAPSPGGTGG